MRIISKPESATVQEVRDAMGNAFVECREKAQPDPGKEWTLQEGEAEARICLPADKEFPPDGVTFIQEVSSK